MSQQFSHLFSPLKIGSMNVRNRIVMSAHNTNYALDLVPNEKLINYWAARAKGGVGLVVTGILWVHPNPWLNTFCMPGALDGLKKAAQAVSKHGAKFVAQIGNMGAMVGHFFMPSPWAPSTVLAPNEKTERFMSHKMTKSEIEDMIDRFANAARMVKEAGIDGLEIHGAHGYLICEFMSPYWNKREDEYGGSLENRMRFPIEIVDAVRGSVGRDFVVGMRVIGDEFIRGGYTLDDMLMMAPMLTRTGKLDYLNVSAGGYVMASTIIEPMYYPLNSFVYCAAAIKRVVDVPVFARGRITDPEQAEKILANNQADMVSMVRAMIADPEFANKAREGRVDDIRKCIGCNEGCWGVQARLGAYTNGISCTMNPATGWEGEPGWGEVEPAAVKKRVMIIGGGPAGLETARVAALRGHQVSLYDRGSELGGQTLIAAKAPGRDGFLDLSRYYSHQMKLLKIDVHLNTEVTAEMVQGQDPQAVVVATGSVPYIPDIPGVDGDNVVEVREVLSGEAEVGDNVIVIGFDSDIQSLSTGELLADRGKKVEIL
ncbi:MAG: hypothetical protein FJ012_06850 [Chloroflexi bacterium]|nr:hypothetical protein [Chloroflexota bacterium]